MTFPPPAQRCASWMYSVIHIFVTRQAAVHGLAQEVSKGQPCVLSPRIGQVLFDEFPESQMFV